MAQTRYNISITDTVTPLGNLSTEDATLIDTFSINSAFRPNKDYVEINILSEDKTVLLTDTTYSRYSVLQGNEFFINKGSSEIVVDPVKDLEYYGFNNISATIEYNFIANPFTDFINIDDFYVQEISPDRTEIRIIPLDTTLQTTVDIKAQEILSEIESNQYFPQYSIYYGPNKYITVINLKTETFRESKAIVLKLYEPLPDDVSLKTKLNIIKKVADSIAYLLEPIVEPVQERLNNLRGPNFSVEIEETYGEPSQYFNFEELFSFPTTNTFKELTSNFAEKGAELGINFADYEEFIHFSSAEERLRNFRYKLQLLENYESNLQAVESTTYEAEGKQGSTEYFKNLIKGLLSNFDAYERYLYYESGSSAWPKTTINKPHVNYLSTSTQGTEWFNSQINKAQIYDEHNRSILVNSIPDFLREDEQNEPYLIFTHMIGQHFDNLWVYADSVSKKYNNDNRLTRGISKDLVEEALKNFGIKLHTSNNSLQDLYKYFTDNTYTNTSEVLPNGVITTNQIGVSQRDYQGEIYKRIYHNLPLLLKGKGTERALRALISSFGVPSDILKIRVYGGLDVEQENYFGPEYPITSSLDKVRLNNTGTTIGNTVSYYTSIKNNNNEYGQDIHKVEIGFSPAYNINEYIVSQSQVLFPSQSFNINEYIGDPRDITTGRYNTLNQYSDLVLGNLDRYNLKDFIRLIKFFDNSLFRMLHDFTPARNVTDTGIIIKSHFLERNKVIPPTLTHTEESYEVELPIGHQTGSDGRAYESIAEGSVDGESSTTYNRIVQTPLGRVVKRYGLSSKAEKQHDEAKYDGELLGSEILITNGELNDDNPFKIIDYRNIRYNVTFYKDVPSNACLIASPEGEFIVNPQLVSSTTLSQIFTGANTQYEYTIQKDGDPNIISNIFEYNFGANGNQYDTFTVNAINSEIEGCQASRIVRVVACSLTPSPLFSNVVVIGQPYILRRSVLTDINTNLTYFVNNVEVVNPESYVFVGQEGDTVTLRIQDTFSPSCRLTINLTLTNCNLEFRGGISITDQGIEFPYGFINYTNNTSYLISVSREQNTGYGTEVPINNPPIVINGPTLPNTNTGLYNLYPAAFQHIIDSGQPINDNFTSYLKIRAAEALGCEQVSSPILLNTPITRVPVQFRYIPEINSGAPLVCGTGVLTTVWVTSTTPLTAIQVLTTGQAIFLSSTGTQKAPQGTYLAPGFEQYNSWFINNAGNYQWEFNLNGLPNVKTCGSTGGDIDFGGELEGFVDVTP